MKKLNTKFRACKKHCGERVWCERPVVCEKCKVVYARVQPALPPTPPSSRVGVAYTRGRSLSARLRRESF